MSTQVIDHAAPAKAGTSNAQARKATVAGICGHIMEWYDFAVYGYVAVYIAKNFFPSDDPTASLLASFATFGVGFAARPFGAFFFGRVGDRLGRKTVLLWTLVLMAAATLIIGVTPGYQTIGVAAPVLLVLARLAQGFSAGGETTAAVAFIVEWAPPKKRGFFGSFQQVGSACGLLLGTIVVAMLTGFLGKEAMLDWGWRVPFIIGAVLAPIGFYIRHNVGETPAFESLNDNTHRNAARVSPKISPRLVSRAFFFSLFWAVGFYFFLSYMPTFALRELKLGESSIFWVNALAVLVYIAFVPVFGALSDRIGRKPSLIVSCAGFGFLLLPLFRNLTSAPNITTYAVTLAITGIFLAMYAGPAAATIAEIFPSDQRSSGMAIGNSLANVFFGGFTPFIATWLIARFGTPIAPIYYVSTCALAGLAFLLTLRESSKDNWN